MNARRRAVAAALFSLAFVLDVPVPNGAPARAPGLPLGAAALAATPVQPAHPRPTRPVSPPLVHAPTRSELTVAKREHEEGGTRVDPGLRAVVHDNLHAPVDPHAMASPANTSARRRSGVRRAASVVGGTGCGATPSAVPVLVSGANADAGINPWWRYAEGSLTGVGRYYLNVANQNVVLQSDDMDVHNAGVDLSFRRTGNVRSQHDSVGTDGTTPSEVGNGWTSTFDTHLSGNAAGGLSVSDIDGARYDYTADGQGHWIAPVGQHATLTTADGGATYQWTKKSGTSYIYAGPYVNQGNSYEGYNGRLLKVVGRNSNTSIALTYYWTCGDAASNANLSEVDAATQAGLTAKLYFADFNGRRLLSKLVWPDGVTTVTYEYSSTGNLVYVHKPAPDASGNPVTEAYVISSSNVVVESPRYFGSNGTEGGYVAIGFSGGRAVSVQSAGVMNFSPPDGTGAPVLPGIPTTPVQYDYLALSNTSAGVNQLSDSNGHNAYYYFDGSNRVTRWDDWTGSQWLANFQSWDANDNLLSTADPRGKVTDYAYDTSGDTIATALPSVMTAQGTFRPTTLYSYDGYHNVRSSCDATWSHANGRDWNVTGRPAASDTLCPITAGSASAPGPIVYQYSSRGEEPYGLLTSATSQLGYSRSFGYGTDAGEKGLPLAVSGSGFTQTDQSSFQESKTFGYDASGNLVQYGTGSGTWSLAYDTSNRLLSATDPDNVTTRTCYYVDGNVRAKQSALQYGLDGAACGANSVSFTYDPDGDVTSETHHFGNALGMTRKWYDGADRLVEVDQPHDPSDVAATIPMPASGPRPTPMPATCTTR